MSGDPKILSNPERLKEIDVNTLVGLADSGAKFIHSKALKYKPKNINVRVINHAYGNLSEEGTLITGGLAIELDAEIAHPFPVAEITVIGNGISANPQIVQEMVEKTKLHSHLLGHVDEHKLSYPIRFQEKNLDGLFNDIHDITKSNKETIAMAVKKDLGLHKDKRRRLRGNPWHNWKNQ